MAQKTNFEGSNIMNRETLSIAVIALQVCFFIGWYMVESNAIGNPVTTITVKPKPYDPRDLLSGQYMRLGYEFSRADRVRIKTLLENGKRDWATDLKCKGTINQTCSRYGLIQDGDVWVTLQKGEGGFHHPIAASFNKPKNTPKDAVLIVGNGHKNASNLTFGIEKYFVPEGTREPKREDTTLKLDVYESGKVRINTLLVKGKEWP